MAGYDPSHTDFLAPRPGNGIIPSAAYPADTPTSMVCPQCRTETPLTTGRCFACSAELSLAGATITAGGDLYAAAAPRGDHADVTRLSHPAMPV